MQRNPLFALLGMLSVAALAQNIPNAGDATSPAPKTPGHALIGGMHETVNPANGSLTITFSVPMPPGRGLTPAFTITYSSAGSHPFGSFGNDLDNMYAQQSLLSSDGWSYGAPVETDSVAVETLDEQPGEECSVSSNYMVQMSDGSRQQLQLSVTGVTQETRPNPDDPCTDQFRQYTSASLGGWASAAPGITDNKWQDRSVTLTSPDGTVIQFPPTAGESFGTLATSMTDRDGNQVTYAITGGNELPSSPFALTLTDTLGRTLTTSGFAQPTDTIAVPGMSSEYTVDWASEPASGSVAVDGDPYSDPCPDTVAALHAGTAITSITTPSGTYTFSYD